MSWLLEAVGACLNARAADAIFLVKLRFAAHVNRDLLCYRSVSRKTPHVATEKTARSCRFWRFLGAIRDPARSRPLPRKACSAMIGSVSWSSRCFFLAVSSSECSGNYRLTKRRFAPKDRSLIDMHVQLAHVMDLLNFRFFFHYFVTPHSIIPYNV